MSDTLNPYQSPETQAVPEKPLTAQGALTETMLIYLKEASPWMRFIGILGFVSSGISFLWGIGSAALVPRFGRNLTPQDFQTLSAMASMAFGGTMAMVGIGGGVLQFFPSLFVFRCGEKIRAFLRSGTDQDLELALKNNKSFWKFCGIVCIIALAFIPLMIVGGIIIGVAAALSQ